MTVAMWAGAGPFVMQTMDATLSFPSLKLGLMAVVLMRHDLINLVFAIAG